MKVIKKKLNELKKPDKNVRMHTQKQLDEFIRSLKMFGQIRPIIIDEDNVILAGNGMYDALIKMGETEADCCQYTGLSDNQKKKLMIADNKVFELGVDNFDVIDEFLKDLGDDLDIPGYDEEVLRQMTTDAEEITEAVSTYGTIDHEDIDRIRKQDSEALSPNAGAQMPQQTTENGQNGAGQNQTGIPSSEEKKPQDGPVDDPEGHQFVICPNCGAKIWL